MSDALTFVTHGPVARLRLDRPDLHNAFDAGLIAALTAAPVSYTHLTLPTTPYV